MPSADLISLSALGYLLLLVVVGVVALLAGIRLGVRASAAPPPSKDEELAAAMSVLRRHLEARALAEMEETGAPLWRPKADRVAQLSYGDEGHAN